MFFVEVASSVQILNKLEMSFAISSYSCTKRVQVNVSKSDFLTPAPKAGVIVVACAVRAAAAAAAAGINLVGVPQTATPSQIFGS